MFKQTKSFAKQKIKWVKMPSLVAMQIDSYKWFLDHGLRELFDEMSPVTDYTGKELELYFKEFYFDEPKFDELKAKENGLSYEAPLRIKIELVNKKTKKAKEQEIYLGDFPLMTDRGTFIVNGVERVVVSQLIRSAGVFFTATSYRGKKFFGAKIIPNRGAWLEFETDSDGVISVKIDRKRKAPVTAFLRAFSSQKSQIPNPKSQTKPKAQNPKDTNQELLKLFKNVDAGAIKYIEATLKKDPSKNADEGFIEIYKRLRPGDPATPENARALVEGMFKRFDRYDLAKVGRFKMNQRLNKQNPNYKTQITNYEYTKEERLLSFKDLTDIVSEIIRLNNSENAAADDIDHLGNRRVRSLGELLQTKLRIGAARMERIIRDRMSTYEINSLSPAQLINARPLMAAVKEFFTSSQLAQFMDQVNPLAELEHKRRISAMGPGGLTRERAGFEVRDVHTSHYGRICPIETPEGPNIGLVVHLTSYAVVNELGFIETPYVKVKNSKITGEIHWLNAFDEEKYVIAHGGTRYSDDGKIIELSVEARVLGKPQIVRREEVQYVDVAPQQIFSVATSLIPFVEHDDATRALMGSNMQRQAVACVKPQAPLVGTGIEERAAVDSGQVIVAQEDGIVAAVDAEHIAIAPTKSDFKKFSRSRTSQEKIYRLNNFLRSNQFTSMSQQPIVKKGEKVAKGEALADGAATQNGNLALGQNLLVAFLSWGGANFEDAIIISERLVKDDRYTSIHIEDYSIDVRDTKLGPEITTPDIPNVSEEKLKNLDEEGIIRIGAEVASGDILVGKISPKGEADLTSEERLLQAIFGEKARDVKDTSLTLSYGKRGRVIGIKIFSRDGGDKLEPGVLKRVQVEVAQLRKVQVGDKLAGRHGNKGVISKILSEEEMPYLADGTPVDIILNPLGVASRMNIGQILETHLGWAASKIGYRALTPALDGATEEDIKAELKLAGLPETGKVRLYDGRTGKAFGGEITVGIIYMMKLNHLVEDKIHMRSVGPYSLITQQPLGGKAQFGGQRFGEMEVWALEGYGAAHTLQEMITIKSDDVTGRAGAFDAIIRGEEIRKPSLPASFNVLVNELKSLGLSVELVEPSFAKASTKALASADKSEGEGVKRVRIRT